MASGNPGWKSGSDFLIVSRRPITDQWRSLILLRHATKPEKNYPTIDHRNLTTRMSKFTNIFDEKNLVKSLLISTLDKVIYYKGIFYGAQQNLSVPHKIGWKPAEKKFALFQQASSSTKISMCPILLS
jgi:hypothetical protein